LTLLGFRYRQRPLALLSPKEPQLLIFALIDDSLNENLLYVCVEDYVRLRKAMPIPMHVFHGWFCALHSDLLGPDHPAEKFIDFFEDIHQMSRPEQKRAAAAAIFRLSRNSDFLAGPATEPLVTEG
jgi:hypothetical protein